MTRYAHWLLPLFGPFVVLGLSRSVWWLAGADWSQPGIAAYVALFFGPVIGFGVAIIIEEHRT